VYTLRCADGTLYTGITKDLARRTQQHNGGTAALGELRRRPLPHSIERFPKTPAASPLDQPCHCTADDRQLGNEMLVSEAGFGAGDAESFQTLDILMAWQVEPVEVA